MTIQEEVDSLSRLFARLGARHPESWAKSQVEEGIPQLPRFLFLRQAWRLIVSNGFWIEESLAASAEVAGHPGAALQPALERLLALGAKREDLTTIARVMQWRALFGFCQLLDDPGDLETEVRDINWRLFQVDDGDQPLEVIAALHESVLETDPTGQEMRPAVSP